MSKSIIFETFQKIHQKHIYPTLNRMGHRIYSLGLRMSDNTTPQAQQNKVLYNQANQKSQPEISNVFMTPCNIVQGDVKLSDSYVFYKNNIRTHAKNSSILIGDKSMI